MHAYDSRKMVTGADLFRWQQHLLRLKDHQGNTALHLAVMEGLPESVQLLLQAGADTNTPGNDAVLQVFALLRYMLGIDAACACCVTVRLHAANMMQCFCIPYFADQ